MPAGPPKPPIGGLGQRRRCDEQAEDEGENGFA